MLTDAQIAAGTARLVNSRLGETDQVDLLSAFRVWLGLRAAAFPSLGEAIAGASPPIADKLAGALILLKEMNFSVTNLSGGRLGVESSKREKRELLIKYAFSLLYALPSESDYPETGIGSCAVSVRGVW